MKGARSEMAGAGVEGSLGRRRPVHETGGRRQVACVMAPVVHFGLSTCSESAHAGR